MVYRHHTTKISVFFKTRRVDPILTRTRNTRFMAEPTRLFAVVHEVSLDLGITVGLVLPHLAVLYAVHAPLGGLVVLLCQGTVEVFHLAHVQGGQPLYVERHVLVHLPASTFACLVEAKVYCSKQLKFFWKSTG